MPTPDIKESPVRTNSLKDGKWTATRTFTAAWYADENAVIDALAAMDVCVNGPHPNNPLLTCDGPDIDQVSPVFWNVKASYSFEVKNDAGTPAGPLNMLPIISWELAATSEQTDQDANHNPFLNSAGDAFAGNLSDQKTSIVLTVTRNEPFFDVSKPLAFVSKVNSDTFSPLGMFSVPAGQAKCLSILPGRAYYQTDLYVPIVYRIEFRPEGFRTWLLDIGSQGWYTAAGGPVKGEFVDSSIPRNRANDVLLDGTGKPLNASFKVGSSGATPIANPAVPPVPATVSKVSTAFATFLGFQMSKEVPFAGMGL